MSLYRRLSALVLSLLLLPALALAGCGKADDQRGPVVLAASSMQDALEEIADRWEAQGHPRPLLSFAASSSLARQVASGAPADVFISADVAWMDWLAERGLIDRAGQAIVATNRLVLVGRPDGVNPAADVAGLLAAQPEGHIAMGDPEAVPAGRYGKAALESLGLWAEVESRVLPAENVRAALVMVERGESEFAIVYRSDALASDKVALLVAFPAASHPPILYPAALLRDARHAQAADFLAFVAGPEGREALSRHGFGPPS